MPVFDARLACVVSTGAPHRSLACELHDLIAAKAADLFTVQCRDELPVAAGCDLWMPLIDEAHLDQAMVDIVAWRARHQQGMVLPLAIGLTQAQLIDLLSAGIVDFLSVPLDEAALLTRLRRAAGTVPVLPRLPQALATGRPVLRELVNAGP